MTIIALARSLADEVESKHIPPSPVPIRLADRDEPIAADAARLGFAEGQSFVIEYKDSAGKTSTRRITVWGVSAGTNGVPSLIARCHERQAQRQFRVDRIACVIDYDGEVFADVPGFLAENFGMDLGLAGRSEQASHSGWAAVLDAIRHDAVILSALARADGKTVAVEVDAATDHLSRLAERGGLMLDDAQILAIYRYANRLRPTEEAIVRALEYLQRADAEHVRRLLIASATIIDADGKRHPKEIALINAIAKDLLGTALF